MKEFIIGTRTIELSKEELPKGQKIVLLYLNSVLNCNVQFCTVLNCTVLFLELNTGTFAEELCALSLLGKDLFLLIFSDI